MRRILLCSLAFAMALLWVADGKAGETSYNLGIIIVKEKALAENLRQRIGKGESFETLAMANSVGPNARRGGRLGVVPASSLRNEYRSAVTSLKPGQVSKVISIEDGYTLLTLFVDVPPAPSPQSQSLPSARNDTPSLAPPLTAPAPSGDVRARFMVDPVTSEAINVGLLTHVLDALEFMQKGDLKNAENSLQQGVALGPQDDTAPLLLSVVQECLAGTYPSRAARDLGDAFTALIMGRGVDALNGFDALVERYPKMWQAWLMEGNLRLENEELDEALTCLNTVVELNPQYARAYLVIGNINTLQFKGQAAEAAFVKAIQIDPGMADGHYFLGRLYMGYGEVEFAEQEYMQAINLNPFMYDAYNDLGNIYLYSNRYQEAETAFSQALKINPGMAPAMVNLGILYARQSRWDEAKTQFEKAIEFSARLLPEAHFNLGLVFIETKQLDAAREQIGKASELGYPIPEAVVKALQ